MRSQSKPRALAALAATLALFGSVLFATPAHATESDDAVDWYVDNGADEATAQTIVDNLEHGIMPDSITEGEGPVSVTQYVEDDFNVTRNEYADGSISLTKTEIAVELAPGVSPSSVYGCVSVPGSGYVSYYNCLVLESNSAYLDVGFEADYVRYAGGGTITAIRNGYAYAFVGTAGTPSLSIVKATSNASGPAQARAATQWNGPISSFTAYTFLNVNGSSAWSTKVGF